MVISGILLQSKKHQLPVGRKLCVIIEAVCKRRFYLLSSHFELVKIEALYPSSTKPKSRTIPLQLTYPTLLGCYL